jgi:hypothetical protein
MPEPTDQPAEHGRSLAGFYITLGVVAALVGLGAWLWTPLRVSYLQYRMLKENPENEVSMLAATAHLNRRDEYYSGDESYGALATLARVGPAAYPAFARLFHSRNTSLKSGALVVLQHYRAIWAMPLIVDVALEQDKDIAWEAVDTVQNLVVGLDSGLRHGASFEEARRGVRSWWEREGQAKYGEGIK